MSVQRELMFNDLIKIPFKFGTTDCWWLAREVYSRYGIDLPDYSVSRMAVELCNLQQVADEIDRLRPLWIEITEPEIPCMVIMSLGVPGAYNHVGVYIGYGKFIHTNRQRGSAVIEPLSNPIYANRKFYRYDSSNDN